MMTYVLPAHNEESTVADVVAQARAAAQDGERVLVVASGCTDATASRASRAGAEVISAPIGKGVAIAAAVRATETDWICFLDADIVTSQHNIPTLLRLAVLDGDSAQQILGEYSGGQGRYTVAVYQPLIARFFPELATGLGHKPLTGFRAVRRAALAGDLPTGFGIESHLNLSIMLSGEPSAVIELGACERRTKNNPQMGNEIARTILDHAEHMERVDPLERRRWEDWATKVSSALAGRRHRHPMSSFPS